MISKCRFTSDVITQVQRITSSRGRAVTPAGSAALAVRADTHAADPRSGTGSGATRPSTTSERNRRQLLFSIENLHAERQVASVEFRQALINKQGI
jgi:hypothetical protein